MRMADTYLDGMSGATVCANALGRGDILSIVIVMTLVMCMARPEAVSQAKPGPNRPGRAGPN
jgi:hypothetical protein